MFLKFLRGIVSKEEDRLLRPLRTGRWALLSVDAVNDALCSSGLFLPGNQEPDALGPIDRRQREGNALAGWLGRIVYRYREFFLLTDGRRVGEQGVNVAFCAHAQKV